MKKRVLSAIVALVALSWVFAPSSDGQEARTAPTIFEAGAGHSDHEQQRAEATTVELLDVGESPDEAVSTAKSGEKWLALDVDGSVLRDCKIEVKSISDGESSDSPRTKEISVDLPLQPLFLIRGGGLTAGPAITVLEGNWEQAIEEKSPLNLRLADASYELKVVGSEDTATCDEEGLPLNARLLLSTGKDRQVIYSLVDCGGGASWYLLWAGDLDRDGKLDLFMSLSPGDHGSSRKLFLSSKASKGRLVKEVAELVSYGC